jgi:hypothetical protein
VALRVMNTSIKILLLEPFNPIDNPHRGSGDWLGIMVVMNGRIHRQWNI